jgi:hypothetical protein
VLRGVRRAPAAAGRLIRRHWALLVLLGIAAVPRLALMHAYPPAFWYHGDSGVYLARALVHVPDVRSPYGYSFALQLLQMLPHRPLDLVPLLQHLGGLAIAVACYAYLQHRGVSRLVSLLAVAPALLDSRTIVVEHYILSDSLYTVLAVTGLIVATGRVKPVWVTCALAGLILAAAGLTRSVGLPLLAVPGLYLLFRSLSRESDGATLGRRLGRTAVRATAFAVCALVPVASYTVWYHGHYGVYSLGTYSGRFLWSRVSTFAECDKVPDLTAMERELCPAQPLDQRLDADLYLWVAGPNQKFGARTYDPMFASFARKVILAQPVDYAQAIVHDTGLFMLPERFQDDRVTCLGNLWRVPEADPQGRRLPTQYNPLCQPTMSAGELRKANRTLVASTRHGRTATALHWYSNLMTLPGMVVGLGVLLVLVFGLIRPRRAGLRASLDPLVWAGYGFGVIVLSVATSASDPRYGVPALPLVFTGAALAWHRLRATTGPATAAGQTATSTGHGDATQDGDPTQDGFPAQGSVQMDGNQATGVPAKSQVH